MQRGPGQSPPLWSELKNISCSGGSGGSLLMDRKWIGVQFRGSLEYKAGVKRGLVAGLSPR